MKAKNIAVIGCGEWGQNLVRTFKELGSLVVTCDTKFQINNDYKKILKSPIVEAVAIATPSSTHFQIAKDSLLAGKDVFVEKPLAMSYADGEELVSFARKKQLILMVGHILAYHPAIVALKKLISEDKLGQIYYIYSNRLNLGRLRTEESVLLSFAPHDISVILDLVGEEPHEVFSYEGSFVNKGIGDTTITIMRFPGGVEAHIFVSWLHPYKEQKLVVVGSKAMVLFNDLTVEKLFIYPHKVEQRIGTVPIIQKAEYELIPELLNHTEPLRLECEHFIKCVETRCQPVTNGQEALRVLWVLDRCQKNV